MTRLVTDGAADLPPEMGLDVTVVRGRVRLGAIEWEGDAERFWAELQRGGELPSTEAPSAGQLVRAYGGGGPVLAIHVSGELSRTVHHARAAAAEIGAGAVRVIDSRSLSVGTGMLVMAAAEAIRAGVGGERLGEMAGGWIDQLHMHALIEDVQYLVHGGRAGLVAGKIGRHARRHVVAVKGHVVPISQVRHRQEAVRDLVDHVREHAAGGVSRWAVGHGAAADVNQFVERLAGVFGSDPSYVTLFGPPVGSHMGPGSLAVSFFSGG